jgi:ribonucleoside-diphosphate reductase alpha chain
VVNEPFKDGWKGRNKSALSRTGSVEIEKSTVQAGSHNAVSSGGGGSGLSAMELAAAAARAQILSASPATDVKFCGVDDPTCEACQ